MPFVRKYDDCHKVLDGIEYKLCKICLEWFICSLDYFYLSDNKIDGLSPDCKDCTCRRSRQRHVDKKKEIKSTKSKWYIKNKERIADLRKVYREENSEYMSHYQSGWRKENPEKIKGYNQNHRNHQMSDQEWNDCRQYFNFRCAYCNLPWEDHKDIFNQDLHREHVDDEGANDLSNCVPSCGSCNYTKNARNLHEWYNAENPKFKQINYDKIVKWLTEDYKEYIKIRNK